MTISSLYFRRASINARLKSTLQYCLSKLLFTLIILIITSILIYLVFYYFPNDPAHQACGKPCTPDNLKRARAFMELDRPWFIQWWKFFSALFISRHYGGGGVLISCSAPCLGYSFQQNMTVNELIFARLPVTFSLGIGAGLLWLILGLLTGIIAAVRTGSWVDRGISGCAILSLSIPIYLSGTILILVGGFILNIIPISGYSPLHAGILHWAWHLIAPWTILALAMAGTYTRITRDQMVGILGQEFIRALKMHGISRRSLIAKHGLKNVLSPIITLFAIDFGAILGGAVITESVFGMDGMGRLLLDAVHTVDLPIISGVILVTTIFVVLANIIIDTILLLIDPRIRTV